MTRWMPIPGWPNPFPRRRTLALSTALALATLAAGGAWYYRSLTWTLPPVDTTADTLVLGASITYRWPERGLDSWLATYGPEARAAAFPGLRVRHFVAQLPDGIEASRIVLDVGGPDLHDGTPPLEVSLRIVALAERLVATTEADVYVLGLLPRPGFEAQIEEANAWTAALVADMPRVHWVPTYVPPSGMGPDGAHPTAEGYRTLGAQVRAVLDDPPRVLVAGGGA